MSSTNGNGNISFDEVTCERYLFGELSEPEQERFENAYFKDDGFFNRYLAIKDELIDLYARGELDASRKRRLERHFRATAPRQRRLAEARDFISSVTLVADRRTREVASREVAIIERGGILESLKNIFRIPMLAGAGALVILFIVGLWMIKPVDVSKTALDSADEENAPSETSESRGVVLVEVGPEKGSGESSRANALSSRQAESPDQSVASSVDPKTKSPQDPIPGEQVEPIQPQQPQTTDPKPDVAEVVKPDNPRPDTSGDGTESVTLSSTSRSPTKTNTASIEAATRNVVVRLLFSGSAYASYVVKLSSLGGGVIWRASDLRTAMKDGAKSIAVTIPAASLTRKDYIVALEGRLQDGTTETIREYYLHVVRH